MGLTIEQVVPWGRNLKEYSLFFNFSENDFSKRIIGVGDGPASFNYEMKIRGSHCVSIDPIYQFAEHQLQARFQDTYNNIRTQLREKQDDFVWEYYENHDQVCNDRFQSMTLFLKDFDKGKKEKRYITGSLPDLPLFEGTFELAVCSHFLFLYSHIFDYEFHYQSVKEMLRVAREVRIFPILGMDGRLSEHVPGIINEYRLAGYNVSVQKVEYEFQKGGNKMLKISRI